MCKYEKEEFIKIMGYACRLIDYWCFEGNTFLLGQCLNDSAHYYAKACDIFLEYDHMPLRAEVEDDWLDKAGQDELDCFEAKQSEYCIGKIVVF